MTLDLTEILVALIAASFPIIGSVVSAIVLSRMKDKESARVIANAVKNSVGIFVEAAQGSVTSAQPHITIPGIPPRLQAPVQYVLDHAGPELVRHGISPEAIAEKVVAQIGLAKVADPTIATDALLAPIGGVTETSADQLNREELARHTGGVP